MSGSRSRAGRSRIGPWRGHRRIFEGMCSSPTDGLAGELRDRLATVIALVQAVVDPDRPWKSPLKYSQAGTELLAEEARQPAPQTGAWPWLMATMLARWALWVAVEEAEALRSVTNTECTSYGADVLCRSVLESSSLAWWLLDPDVDAERRLARVLLYRYNTANRGQQAAQHLGLPVDEDRSNYGEVPERVEQEARELGFEIDPKRLVCRGVSLPSYTERVADLVQHVWPREKLPYAILSAVAHAELLGLTRNLGRLSSGATPSQTTASATLRSVPDHSGVWFWQDTYLVTGTLLFSGQRAAAFLGLAQQAQALGDAMGAVQDALMAVRPTTT